MHTGLQKLDYKGKREIVSLLKRDMKIESLGIFFFFRLEEI